MASALPRSIRFIVLVQLVLSNLILAIPSWSNLALQIREVGDIKDSYDYIIVGGGTAGLTVADRLSESGKYTVLVIEHGKFYNASDPDDFPMSRRYNLTSVPQANLDNKEVQITIGHCVGGSSAINGMAVMRGTMQEYDNWAELGNPGSTWNWDGMLPYFHKAIHFVEPRGDWVKKFKVTYDIRSAWGQYEDTRLYASYLGWFNPLVMIFYEAYKRVPGLNIVRGGHSGTHGLFYYPISLDPNTQQRSYARTAHWDGLERKNYDIITGSRGNKILFKGNKASAVRFVPKENAKANPTVVKARKEIIISAGGIHTPQVLQLSGIGPARLLEQAGIQVKVNLPGVGSNLQDHPLGPLLEWKWAKQPKKPFENNYTGPTFDFATGQGLVAQLSLPLITPKSYITLASTYACQNLSHYLEPDTPPAILAGYQAQQRIYAREMQRTNISFLSNLFLGNPRIQPVGSHIMSRGHVRINTTDPESEPLIDFRALSNPLDIELWVAYMRFLLSFLRSPVFAPYEPTPINPPNSTTDEGLRKYIRSVLSPHGWHPLGTASKMRRELGGVVDDELKVYGVDGLRVVDASVMPLLVAASTQLTVYAIAEKAVGLIMEERE